MKNKQKFDIIKLALIFGIFCFVFLGSIPLVHGAPPSKSKFYDFNDQIIDGEIKKPTALYTEGRKKVEFDRLLKLKKSFIPDLMETSKESTFK